MTYASSLARLSDVFAGGQGIPLANRNYIVDGNFEQWTAANGPATGAYPAATMFRASQGVGGTGVINQVAWQLGSEPIWMTTPSKLLLGFNQTVVSTGSVAGSNAPYIFQPIESVRTLQGRSATFSATFGLAGGSPFTIPSVLCRQFFGSGGSPSATVVIDKTVSWVVSGAAWVRFSVRLDIPSIVGKTLGTNGDDQLQIGVWLPPNVLFNLYTAQWQLEQSSANSSPDINGKGGAPTVFEFRGYQAELARVQRHYYTLGSSAQAVLCMSAITSATGMFGAIQFPVTMRMPPACTSANMQGSSISQVSPGTSSSYAYLTTQAAALTLNCSGAAWTAGQAGVVYVGGISGGGGAFIADARL